MINNNTDKPSQLKKTPLYDLHCEQGARMVPFAGYEMPVSYPLGIKQEHLHCRTQAGLFDISHMGQIRLQGKQAVSVLESLIPSKISDLQTGQQKYSVLSNDRGGILDDIMVTNMGDHLLLVVNAACKHEDVEYLQSMMRDMSNEDCQLEFLQDKALMALQGPAAASVLEEFSPETARLHFMQGGAFNIRDIPCVINRCGYTGEDGFEISIPVGRAEDLARLLLKNDKVRMIGLGARDTLRLEAGFCLYGHDIGPETSPVEAAIEWIIADKTNKSSCPGAEIIWQQLASGVTRRRVGLMMQGKVPLREGMDVLDDSGQLAGCITSGGFSPTLGKPIAMAYIKSEFANTGSQLQVNIRNKNYQVETVALPFVKHRYHRSN
ncbi:MAG: glycine cleavage system aminomethyltransferase GcvT [Gammaproteobacteria bacterium]|nr:MAG: glycine cleavage system aminomethyltransferase GcvT [Gammaproteobacteria bacterium]